MSVSDENLSEQFSLMARNKKSLISGRNHLNEPIFFLPQNVSQDHFHKIGKFKKIAKTNIKEQRQNTGKYLSFFRCSVAMTTSYSYELTTDKAD